MLTISVVQALFGISHGEAPHPALEPTISSATHSRNIGWGVKGTCLVPFPCNLLTPIKQVKTKVNPNRSVPLFPVRVQVWNWAHGCSEQARVCRCHLWHTHVWFGGFLHAVTLQHLRCASLWGRSRMPGYKLPESGTRHSPCHALLPIASPGVLLLLEFLQQIITRTLINQVSDCSNCIGEKLFVQRSSGRMFSRIDKLAKMADT